MWSAFWPSLQNGDPDVSFFSPDCFHFSSKGHAMGAMNTWNNMVSTSLLLHFNSSVRFADNPTKFQDEMIYYG